MRNDNGIRRRRPSGRGRGVRQICAKRPGSPALDGFQLGVRLPENPRKMSSPRYEFAVSSCESRSYGKIAYNAAPDLRQKKFAVCGHFDGLSDRLFGRKLMVTSTGSVTTLLGR